MPEKILFPSWRYKDGASCIVATQAESDALGPDWSNSSAPAPTRWQTAEAVMAERESSEPEPIIEPKKPGRKPAR